MTDLRLFYVPELLEFRIDQDMLLDVKELELDPERTIERLRETAAMFDRFGKQYPRTRVDAIVKELEGVSLW